MKMKTIDTIFHWILFGSFSLFTYLAYLNWETMDHLKLILTSFALPTGFLGSLMLLIDDYVFIKDEEDEK